MNEPAFDAEDLENCLEVLRWLKREPQHCSLADSPAGEIAKQSAQLLRAIKAFEKQEAKKRDQDQVEAAGIRQQREHRAETATNPPRVMNVNVASVRPQPEESQTRLSNHRSCYVCKRAYQTVHHFYDLMCPECGEFNFAKRTQSADLSGMTSLVTGGRIKIGFQIALKLLRAGSRVLITSRFPHDAALRFSQVADFIDWQDRLAIYSADFRYLPHVRELAQSIAQDIDHLEILINNAAQTVRRPPAFYRHLLDVEAQSRSELPRLAQALIASEPQRLLAQNPSEENSVNARVGLHPAAAMTQLPLLPEDSQTNPAEFPPGQLDSHGQQLDHRAFNSWVQRLADVSMGELVEVHAVNCLSPYILIGCLEPLMIGPPECDRFIVNVSAMEGKFHAKKTGFHPHTNMAKAAMNMITRTCAERFAHRRIFMNSVDTGWITNEFPQPKTQQMAEEGFQPPLDETDGAARVCDPIFTGIKAQDPLFGKFLKDYREVTW